MRIWNCEFCKAKNGNFRINCGFLTQCVPTTIYCLTKPNILFVLSIDKLNLEKASLKSWREKITDENNDEEELPNKAHEDVDQVLTIGTIGYPNVGKSSLINSLMGKRVVSVSKTPGHTKHFQTIFINSKIRLCDCPGLVFPSKISFFFLLSSKISKIFFNFSIFQFFNFSIFQFSNFQFF